MQIIGRDDMMLPAIAGAILVIVGIAAWEAAPIISGALALLIAGLGTLIKRRSGN